MDPATIALIGMGVNALGGYLSSKSQGKMTEQQLREAARQFELQFGLQQRALGLQESQANPYTQQRHTANQALMSAIMPGLQNFQAQAPTISDPMSNDISSWIPKTSGGMASVLPADSAMIGGVPWRQGIQALLAPSAASIARFGPSSPLNSPIAEPMAPPPTADQRKATFKEDIVELFRSGNFTKRPGSGAWFPLGGNLREASRNVDPVTGNINEEFMNRFRNPTAPLAESIIDRGKNFKRPTWGGGK